MSFRLSDIAAKVGAHIIGDREMIIYGAGTIQDGEADEIGFLAESKYAKYAANTRLGALLVSHAIDETPATQLVVDDVKCAWQKVAELFLQQKSVHRIHEQVSVETSATLGQNISIGAGSVVENGVKIGDNCCIGCNVVIEEGVEIGRDSYIASGAKILRGTRIGQRAYIDSGAVIGSRGFGYAFAEGRWSQVPQLGGVQIGDDVDIGANTTIDCGAIRDTIIENGVKLDNLIQVGHNVHIGQHTIIAGNCVIAGSVHFGAYCVVGGASVFAGHIQICDGAQFTGHSSVSKSITKPGVYCSALTVMPHKQWARFIAKLKLFGKEK